MKVLAKGTEPLPWSTRISCFTCRSALEVTQDDLFQTIAQADDDRNFHVSIACPACKELTTIDGNVGGIPHPPAGGYPREAAWRRRQKLRVNVNYGAVNVTAYGSTGTPPESEHELTPHEKTGEELRLYRELRDDVLKGMRIANTLTLDTQSVEEACTALVDLTRKARKERDDYEAKALKLLRVAQVLTAWMKAKQDMQGPSFNPITKQERIDAMSIANHNLEAIAKTLT